MIRGSTTIPKVTSSFSLSQTSVNLDLDHMEHVIHVTRAGNGEITVVPNNSNVAVEVIGDNIHLRGENTGSTVLSISIGAGSHHKACPATPLSVTTQLPSRILADCTWSEIKQAAKAKAANKLWPLGALSALTPLQGTVAGTELDLQVRFRLVDFNHNAELEGDGTVLFWLDQNADGVPIALCDALYGEPIEADGEGFCMNRKYQIGLQAAGNAPMDGLTGANGPNLGGWEPSYGRYLCALLFKCLPADLQSAISPSTIYTDNVGGMQNLVSSITATEDLLYFPSVREIHGFTVNVNENIWMFQTQIAWLAAGNSAQAKSSLAPTQGVYYWGRDSSPNNDYTFCGVQPSGNVMLMRPATSRGLRPLFKL